jgi:hypothetical protein
VSGKNGVKIQNEAYNTIRISGYSEGFCERNSQGATRKYLSFWSGILSTEGQCYQIRFLWIVFKNPFAHGT